MTIKRTQVVETTITFKHTLELHAPEEGDEGMPYVWVCGGCRARKRMNFPKPNDIPSEYKLKCAACGLELNPSATVKALNG